MKFDARADFRRLHEPQRLKPPFGPSVCDVRAEARTYLDDSRCYPWNPLLRRGQSLVVEGGGGDFGGESGDVVAVVGAGEAGAGFGVVGGVGQDGVGGGEFGMAAVLRLEGAEQRVRGFGGFGDGTGGVEFGRGEVAVGGDEVLVVATDGGDGLLGFRLGFGETWARRALNGERGDVEPVEGGASAFGIEAVGEDAVDDLRGEELDGGAVFEEGHGNILRLGQGRAAVAVVGEAEMESADDIVFAALAIDAEGAAARAVGGHGLRALRIESAAGRDEDGFGNGFGGHWDLQKGKGLARWVKPFR